MSTRSERPASAEQIHAALVALEAEPAAGPQAGPEGAREADRLRLLGSLLAKVELEITVAIA